MGTSAVHKYTRTIFFLSEVKATTCINDIVTKLTDVMNHMDKKRVKQEIE